MNESERRQIKLVVPLQHDQVRIVTWNIDSAVAIPGAALHMKVANVAWVARASGTCILLLQEVGEPMLPALKSELEKEQMKDWALTDTAEACGGRGNNEYHALLYDTRHVRLTNGGMRWLEEENTTEFGAFCRRRVHPLVARCCLPFPPPGALILSERDAAHRLSLGDQTRKSLAMTRWLPTRVAPCHPQALCGAARSVRVRRRQRCVAAADAVLSAPGHACCGWG